MNKAPVFLKYAFELCDIYLLSYTLYTHSSTIVSVVVVCDSRSVGYITLE